MKLKPKPTLTHLDKYLIFITVVNLLITVLSPNPTKLIAVTGWMAALGWLILLLNAEGKIKSK